MKQIKKIFIISCKEATYLVSLKEEGKLSIVKYLKLKLHLTICAFCKRFEIQTTEFCLQAKHLPEHTSNKMSTEKKIAIKLLLKEA